MHRSEAPENFSSLKRTSIAIVFLGRIDCVEELVGAWLLADVFLAGLIGVCCHASWLDRLTFCDAIVGLPGIWYWSISGMTSGPKRWFSQFLVAYVSDYEDCMVMGIEIGLEMHNQTVWYLEFHILVEESYSVRNWMIFLSAPFGVAPSFAESVAVLRPVAWRTKDVVSIVRQ